MQGILDKIDTQYQSKLPFVIYAAPNSETLQAFFQRNAVLESFSGQSGFVFAPFSNSEKYILSEKQCDFFEVSIKEKNNTDSTFEKEETDPLVKNDFEDLVKRSVDAILEGQFQKVVVSRKVNLAVSINFKNTFLKLVMQYKTAFRYLFFHPEIGMWMGATPEQLLKIEGTTINTVALAGTQLYNDTLVWEAKEIQEQQFVTDFITNEIKPFVEEIKLSEPYTAKAGTLAHIKTNIEATLINRELAKELLYKMHPTPAVCGLPKKEAMEFVLKEERYDRKFYSGFLGEWNRNETSNLFVNLRCMEIEEKQINLYVGCGITKDSIPEKEFYETENKLATMLKIIN